LAVAAVETETEKAENEFEEFAERGELMSQLAEAQRRLGDVLGRLSMKVAICECERRDECEVFRLAREIVKRLDEMSEITERTRTSTQKSKKKEVKGRRASSS